MSTAAILKNYRAELQHELQNILEFWMSYTIDHVNGGFYGKLNNDNHVFADAPKGSVLNSRILWAFSAAYNLTKKENYGHMATRAYEYFINHFIDEEFGGVFWSVDYKGRPLDTKKQVYALSFAVYGLSEYYSCSKVEQAKTLAIKLYNTIVEFSYDNNNSGYIEALTRDWKEMDDTRLSAKDANERKSMNTHLHVLEGFANLYLIWPNETLKNRIAELINIFLNRIIHRETNHLILFFNDQWNPQGNIRSYGHDIEAAWLIQEAAEIIKDEVLVEKVKEQSVKITEAATRGLDSDGGLWYEYDAGNSHLTEEKHWWPQAEAMVGYFNTWQTTGDDIYLQKSLNSWGFIKKYILDKEKGEWLWGVTNNHLYMKEQDKVGIWKCPYHNGRACMEIIKRIGAAGAETFSENIVNNDIATS